MPDEAGVAVEEEQKYFLEEEEVEMELGANWEAFDWLEDFGDKVEDDETSMEEIEIDEQEEKLSEAEEEKEKGGVGNQ